MIINQAQNSTPGSLRRGPCTQDLGCLYPGSRFRTKHCCKHGIILKKWRAVVHCLWFLFSPLQVKGPGIGLLGISKGGDLCLSMASFLKGITAAAIINGSVANVGAVLRYKDITIPPLSFNAKRIKVNKSGIADIFDVLSNPLEGPDRQSLIPLEKAECRFLFIVGQDDRNWKSEFFAVEGGKRLQAHGKEKPEIVCYPGAGHYIEPPFFPMCAASMHLLVGMPVVWGGEPKAHCEAQIDAWQQILAFFRKHLSGEPSGISSKM